MKALTICQPWAWAIAAGIKTIENRGRRTNYRGPLLIHAGRGLMYRHLFGTSITKYIVEFPDMNLLQFGGIIAQVNLVDCVPVSQLRGERFAEGPWCWIMENVQPLAFTPAKGNLGLWNWEGPIPSPHP